jgi:hypothetical protein
LASNASTVAEAVNVNRCTSVCTNKRPIKEFVPIRRPTQFIPVESHSQHGTILRVYFSNPVYAHVRFEVFTAMKNAVFWDVALCRSCANRRFGETYPIHLQGRGATFQKTIFFILCRISKSTQTKKTSVLSRKM